MSTVLYKLLILTSVESVAPTIDKNICSFIRLCYAYAKMKNKGMKLYCFSPPVMVATFVIETALFVYTLVRYRMTTTGRLIAAALVLLALFQLAEFKVCTTGGLTSVWSRFGYMAITLLPPVGVHLIVSMAKRPTRWLVTMAYTIGILFALVFGLSATAFANHICAGNYVIFQLANGVGGAYFAYYYALLFIGIVTGLFFMIDAKPKIREALALQVLGYLSFLLPTAVVNTLDPQTISGIPSVMCGFAVLYALILVFGIAPRVLSPRTAK